MYIVSILFVVVLGFVAAGNPTDSILYIDSFKLYLPFAHDKWILPTITSEVTEEKVNLIFGSLPLAIASIGSNLGHKTTYIACLLLSSSVSLWFLHRIDELNHNSAFTPLFILVLIDVVSVETLGILGGSRELVGPLFLRYPNSMFSTLAICAFAYSLKFQNTKLMTIIGAFGLLINVYVGVLLGLWIGIILLVNRYYKNFVFMIFFSGCLIGLHFLQMKSANTIHFQEYLGKKITIDWFLVSVYFALSVFFSFVRRPLVSIFFFGLFAVRCLPIFLGYTVQPFHWERDVAFPAFTIFSSFWLLNHCPKVFKNPLVIASLVSYLIAFGLKYVDADKYEPYILRGDKFEYGVVGLGWSIDGSYIPAPPFTLDSPTTHLLRWSALACVSSEDETIISDFLESKYGYYSVYYLQYTYSGKRLGFRESDLSVYLNGIVACRENNLQGLSFRDRFDFLTKGEVP